MNKFKNILITSFCLFLCLFILTSCGKKYNVEYLVDGEVFETLEVKKGQTADEMLAPEKNNYVFVGWFDGENLFDFSTEIKKDYKLNAKYVIICEEDGHNWSIATCSEAKKCYICGITEGNPLPHTYSNDCDTMCDVCNNERTIEHTYSSGCDTVCNICNATRVSSEEHEYLDATYDNPKTCKHCGETSGDPLTRPERIELNILEKDIYIGETIQFEAIIFPNVAPQKIGYSLRKGANADATLTEEGLLTAIKEGSVYVTAYSIDDQSISVVATINILHPVLEDERNEVFNIMTGLGQDSSTQVEINYHAYNTNSVVEYTLATDTTFSDFSSLKGTAYYFTNGTDKLDFPFAPRNVIRVSISHLKPNTEYMYRINKGDDTYSEIYKFKTAPDNGGDTSFMVLADIHYYIKQNEDGGYVSHGSEISEDTINQALLKDPNISFIATAGDIIDTGGNSEIWRVFFEESKSLKTLPRIGVAGNHEYYIGGTTQSDGRYQKAHYASPLNGPKAFLGLSCWYRYNDILFLIVDNERGIARQETLAWMEEVFKANMDCRYSFAMMHTPVYYENNESSNKDRDEEFLAIFDKYSVDMVLAGHYHGDRLRTDYYEGATSTDPGLGVNYMSLTSAGVKGSAAMGYIFKTSNGQITVTLIDSDGNEHSVRSVTSKRNQPSETASKEELIKSINGTYDETSGNYTINFSSKFYGNVKEVSVVETLRNQFNKTIVIPTPSYNKIVIKPGFSGIEKFYNHNFAVTVTFNDGTKETVNLNLNLSTDFSPSVQNITKNSALIMYNAADSTLDWTIKEYIVYVNGVEKERISYLDYQTSYQLYGLKADTNYEVKFVAVSYQSKVLFSFDATFKTLA